MSLQYSLPRKGDRTVPLQWILFGIACKRVHFFRDRGCPMVGIRECASRYPRIYGMGGGGGGHYLLTMKKVHGCKDENNISFLYLLHVFVYVVHFAKLMT